MSYEKRFYIYIHNGCRNAKVKQLGMFIDDDHIIGCDGSTKRRYQNTRRFEGTVPTPRDPPLLPLSRVSDQPPFTQTGIDFAGSLYATNTRQMTLKVYTGLFTCASTRAIHFEFLDNLSVPSFFKVFEDSQRDEVYQRES